MCVKLGKVAIKELEEAPGFVVNRILIPRSSEVYADGVASVED